MVEDSLVDVDSSRQPCSSTSGGRPVGTRYTFQLQTPVFQAHPAEREAVLSLKDRSPGTQKQKIGRRKDPLPRVRPGDSG